MARGEAGQPTSHAMSLSLEASLAPFFRSLKRKSCQGAGGRWGAGCSRVGPLVLVFVPAGLVLAPALALWPVGRATWGAPRTVPTGGASPLGPTHVLATDPQLRPTCGTVRPRLRSGLGLRLRLALGLRLGLALGLGLRRSSPRLTSGPWPSSSGSLTAHRPAHTTRRSLTRHQTVHAQHMRPSQQTDMQSCAQGRRSRMHGWLP